MAFASSHNPFPIAEVKPIDRPSSQGRNVESRLLRQPKRHVLNTQDETLIFETLYGENTLNETNLAGGVMSDLDNNDVRTNSPVLTHSIYSPSSNDHWITVLKAPTAAVCTSITSQAYHYTQPATPQFPVSSLEHNCITTRVIPNRQYVTNEPLSQPGNILNTHSWNSALQNEHYAANPRLNRKSSDLRLEDVHQEVLEIKRQLGLSNSEENGQNSSPAVATVSLHDYQKMEQKLGATEFELEMLRQTLKESAEKIQAENKHLTSKIHKYKETVSQWKTKFNKLEDENQTLMKKMKSFENYLRELPTQEEMLEMKEKIEALQDDKVDFEKQLAEEQKNVAELKEKIRGKDTEIENHVNEKEDLQSQINKLKEEIKVYELKKQLRSSAETQDIDEILWQNDKLKREINAARKLLETKQHRFEATLKSNEEEKTKLEQALKSERNTVESLQKEVKNREKKLVALKSAVKELTKKNQDLLDSNVHSRQRLLDAAQNDHSAMETMRLKNKLFKQLQLGFHELKNLVNVIQVQTEGGDPNISMMLGSSVDAVLLDKENLPMDDKHLKERLQEMRSLRKDIESLRNKLSSKFAETLAHNMTCNTQ